MLVHILIHIFKSNQIMILCPMNFVSKSCYVILHPIHPIILHALYHYFNNSFMLIIHISLQNFLNTNQHQVSDLKKMKIKSFLSWLVNPESMRVCASHQHATCAFEGIFITSTHNFRRAYTRPQYHVCPLCNHLSNFFGLT